MPLKIGIFVDSLRMPIADALALAGQWGVSCFQVYVTKGPMLAANMPAAARAEFRKRYEDLGLKLSATCGDFGLNFGDAAALAAKEPLLLAAIDQTVDLGASIMTTHVGHVGDDPAREKVMIEALHRLGDVAAGRGVVLATETGLESGPRLRSILQRSQTSGIGVNFDPANLVMRGFDHFEAVRELFGMIAHTHAKDGRRNDGEVPLGEGDVDFPRYVKLLTELGYDGAYVIEREVGPDPVGDVKRAVEYLKRL